MKRGDSMEEILFESEIACVMIARDESPYVQEWIEYHHGLGVDKFYIYDNNNSQREKEIFEEVLIPWIDHGIVELIDFPGNLAQMPAYDDAILNHRFDCRYMIFIDGDEFIVPKNGERLEDILNEYFSAGNNIGGFAINWRLFGSNGHETQTKDGVLERFTMRAEEDFLRHRDIKTVVNPRRVRCFTNPHYARYFVGCGAIDERKVSVPQGQNPQGTVERIQINHYYLKSREEFFKKRQRGRADFPKNYSIEQFEAQDRNVIEDVVARDLFPQLKQISEIKFQRSRNDGSQRALTNLNLMLAPILQNNSSDENFYGQTEKFLTCFSIAHNSTSLSDDAQIKLKEIALECVNRSLEVSELESWDALLLFDMLPEIIATQTEASAKILGACKEVLPTMLEIANENIDWESYHWLSYFQRFLM